MYRPDLKAAKTRRTDQPQCAPGWFASAERTQEDPPETTLPTVTMITKDVLIIS
jgi:hypothetical protein